MTLTARPRTRTRQFTLVVSASLVLTVGCTSGSAKSQPPASADRAADTGTATAAALLGPATAITTTTPSASAQHPIGYWPTYHDDNTRAGVDSTSPALTATGKTKVAWSRHLDGAVYASPLIVGSDDIVATENDTVYSLHSGHVMWSRHLGTPVNQATLPCGNINPLGITGTPAYDGTSGVLYVAAELSGPLRHTLFALDVVTGKVLWSRSLDVAGMVRPVEQQRGALTVANGSVYVPLGGLYGDCGPYHGYVIGFHTTGAGPMVYQTADTEAGIWAPSGLAVTPNGHLLASVGNSAHTTVAQGYDHSDAILSLSPTLKLSDYFSPTTWAADNAADLDLSSMGPAYLPGGKVFIAGKRGVAYLTSATHLGHVGGQLSTLTGCASYGGTAYHDGVVFAPCNDGLEAIAISGNHMKVRWKAASNIAGSPIYGAGAVWSLDQNAGVLYALSPATGKVLRQVDVGQTSRFATMAMVHGYLHVPTLAGIVVVRAD